MNERETYKFIAFEAVVIGAVIGYGLHKDMFPEELKKTYSLTGGFLAVTLGTALLESATGLWRTRGE